MASQGIYIIQSLIYPERIYIGSALDIIKRRREHFWRLKNQKHENPKLQNHYNKYGEDDLVFEVIEEGEYLDKNHLLSREQGWYIPYEYMQTEIPYFNICKIAGSREGVPCSDETKRKIGESNKGRVCSEETILKMTQRVPWNKGLKGVQVGWSKGLPKEQQPNFGKKNSQESKDKRSKKLIGRPVSEKTLAVLSKNWGKQQSAESNKKKGVHARGKKQSPEHVAKRVASTKATYDKRNNNENI